MATYFGVHTPEDNSPALPRYSNRDPPLALTVFLELGCFVIERGGPLGK